MPILGVCLGHQAIGQAFGGKVVRAPAPVHGKLSEIRHDGSGVFRGINGPFKATRYHSLVVERASLPASSPSPPRPATAWSWASRTQTLPVHGVQFHPESIASEHGHLILKNFLDLAAAWNAAATGRARRRRTEETAMSDDFKALIAKVATGAIADARGGRDAPSTA